MAVNLLPEADAARPSSSAPDIQPAWGTGTSLFSWVVVHRRLLARLALSEIGFVIRLRNSTVTLQLCLILRARSSPLIPERAYEDRRGMFQPDYEFRANYVASREVSCRRTAARSVWSASSLLALS